jgi:DNA-binding response OmpR family regulator
VGILIVEDSDEMLWMMDKVLQNSGFEVDAATSGQEAIRKIKESNRIQLIILNYLLPDMSGVNVLNQVRSNGFKGEVIGISVLKEARDSFISAGVFAFLEKPFNINELIGLCKQAFSTGNA